MKIKTLFTLIFIAGISIPVFAQDSDFEPSEERSDFDQRKVSIMDGNRLRASYHNTGHAGRRNSSSLNELLFEFPRNTNREYMYFMSLMYGTEVPNQNAENTSVDEFAIVDVAAYRTNKTGTQSWTINPIEGYSRDNSSEIARSDRGPESPLGNTWPDAWPDKFNNGGDGWAGSWNGYFGRDQFNADVEFYYKAGDDTYTRYLNGEGESGTKFQPDQTDPTRGGLGLILDARVLAWSQTLVNATHFNLFELKNDASYDYPRMSFGLWIADAVGGANATDEPLFDNIRAIAYLTDTDRTSGGNAFDETLIGEMGLKFLETPGNPFDGIDNDGDSDAYNSSGSLFEDGNSRLYQNLLTANGGFYNSIELVADTVLRPFEAEDFEERTISIGDKIVLIQDDYSRVVTTYDGSPFVSQGVTYDYDGANSFTVIEDLLDSQVSSTEIHIDGLDNDFDGLIDENQPNHLTKNTYVPDLDAFVSRPVRFINYLYFEPGDTLKRGLMVPNQTIRDRMANDADFADMVNIDYKGRLQNFNTSAPMIDEGREDYFDNDNDWNILIDDVGIEGDRETFSEGQGDGLPSSGAGTSFPGESGIDKTDVSETDLIGVTRVRIFDAGALQVLQDGTNWDSYLKPGEFAEQQGTDSDIFVASGVFPLLRGTSERFAVAITAAQENTDNALDDRKKVNTRLDDATRAYEADYQFAVAPEPPILQAVAGDGKVTLYWNTDSEESFDRYINLQTGNGNDFEGYKIYRTTDVSFEEIRSITDGLGSATYLKPIATYNKKNGIYGFHPVSENGLQFDMGQSDNGLQHMYEDNSVINGRTYYYAVTAFDHGFVEGGISPSESPVQISLNPNGTVTLGQNVISIRPSRSQAGYISPDTPNPSVVSGAPGGDVEVEIVDPSALKADNLYEIVFEDTLVDGGSAPDTLKTRNFTLRNITTGTPDTLLSRSENMNGSRNPVTEGFTVRVTNLPEFGLNDELSGWEYDHTFAPHGFEFLLQGKPKISDYNIIVGDNVGYGQSTEKEVEVAPNIFQTLPSMATNFKVVNTYTNEEIKYAFGDLNSSTSAQQRCNPTIIVPGNYTPPAPGELSAVSGFNGRCSDVIFFIEENRGIQDTLTFRIEMVPLLVEGNLETVNPQAGDTLKLITTKPFSSNDVYRFRFDAENIPSINADSAKNQLDDILVIPNPYKVANIFEGEVTSTNLQHNRELHFTGIPAPSTLRIFTVSGVMIREIQISESDLTSEYGGTYIWDMLTKDNLEISYGIYLYHIEAPGIGEKVGKFAVIK